MTLPEILNYFFGSTTLVSIYIAWSTRKQQINIAKADAMDKVADVFAKMATLTEKRLDEMLLESEIMRKKHDILERKLDEYITQCRKCENNKIK